MEKTMKKFIDRFKKLGSSRRKKDIGESSRAKPKVEDGFDEDHPYGYDEFRNYLFRHTIPYPDDQLPPDSSPNVRCLEHPIYSGVRFEWQDILNGSDRRARIKLLARDDISELFRCNVSDSNSVAVKFPNSVNPSGHQEFMAEIRILQKASHENVIKLIGKSFGRDEVALVYEFMPGGSLDQHLFKYVRQGPAVPLNKQVLTWEMRVNIAAGVAEALAYLHNELKVIHRDVKVGNVLLDHEFMPKLTNFELAVDIEVGEEGNETEWVIDPHKGTPGCIAPETANSGTVSSKCDVYSYGVFLFQLFTGLKAFDFSKPPAVRNLTDWMKQFWNGDEYVPNVMDPPLRKKYSVQGLNSIYEAARKCTDLEANARPNMGEVVAMVREAASQVVQEFN